MKNSRLVSSVNEIGKSKDLPENYIWKLAKKLCGLINESDVKSVKYFWGCILNFSSIRKCYCINTNKTYTYPKDEIENEKKCLDTLDATHIIDRLFPVRRFLSQRMGELGQCHAVFTANSFTFQFNKANHCEAYMNIHAFTRACNAFIPTGCC